MPLLTLAVTAALALPATAPDSPRVTVIDTALAATGGTLVAIDPTGVTIAPESGGGGNGGAPRTFPLASVALVAPEEWWSPARRWPGPIRSTSPNTPGAAVPSPIVLTPTLELTDGSLLPGTPKPPSAENTVAWEHALLGTLEFKLDQVRSITFPPILDSVSSPSAGSKAGGENDTLILRNGDRLDGFVAGIVPDEKDQSLAVKLEVKGSVSTIPLARIALARLNNPATRPSGVGIWLEGGGGGGGTAATVSRALLADGQPLTVWTPGQKTPRDIPAQFLRAFMPDSARLRSLAGLEIASQKPAPGRGWWRPAVVRPTSGEIAGASEVELPGPMFVEWKLPENATRLGGWIVLPEDCRAWGECEITITLAGGGAGASDKDLLKTKLSDSHPQAPLNLELPPHGTGPRTLRITLAEGSRGAVQTRAVLRRAILVCK